MLGREWGRCVIREVKVGENFKNKGVEELIFYYLKKVMKDKCLLYFVMVSV